MRRVGENFAPPAVGIQRAVDETVAKARSGFGLLVPDGAKMIAGDVKPLSVELAYPSLDWNFPVGMAVEKAADNSDTDHLARCRRRRQWWWRKTLRDDPADNVAIGLLQCAVVVALIGEQEGMAGAYRLDQVSLHRSAFEVLAKRAQLFFIGRTALRDFSLILVDDWQFGETCRQPCLRMPRLDCQGLRKIGGGLFIAADFQQQAAALVPGFGIARI